MPTATFRTSGLYVGSNETIKELNEFKKELILWSQNQATGYRVQASIGKTKHNHDIMTAKADSFDFMSKYLEGMEIKE